MAAETRLETSRLLGFDRHGDPLWGVAINAPQAGGDCGRPVGIDKPDGHVPAPPARD